MTLAELLSSTATEQLTYVAAGGQGGEQGAVRRSGGGRGRPRPAVGGCGQATAARPTVAARTPLLARNVGNLHVHVLVAHRNGVLHAEQVVPVVGLCGQRGAAAVGGGAVRAGGRSPQGAGGARVCCDLWCDLASELPQRARWAACGVACRSGVPSQTRDADSCSDGVSRGAPARPRTVHGLQGAVVEPHAKAQPVHHVPAIAQRRVGDMDAPISVAVLAGHLEAARRLQGSPGEGRWLK